jgi:hypothetical protein
MDEDSRKPEGSPEGEDRRRFLERCGRFAIVTPPAMTMLLSVAAKPKEAHASTVLGGGLGGGGHIPRPPGWPPGWPWPF